MLYKPELAQDANSGKDDKQRAFAAGFNHHLTKPIAGEELLALLRSLSESPAD